MNIINNTNAQVSRPGAKIMNFPDVLSHFEHSNGNSPLTSQERNDMLHLIAGTASPPGSNNALVSPTPPPPPNLEQIHYTQSELDELVRMQQEQEAKLSEVAGLIQPLSPSGSIPGLTDNYFPDTNQSPSAGGNLDLDQYLDTGAYYTNGDGSDFNYDGLNFNTSDPSNFDFSLDGANDSGADAGRVVESRASSESRDNVDSMEDMQGGEQRSPSKRRRKG
jgi:heat shock transcription factor, other eukaryote